MVKSKANIEGDVLLVPRDVESVHDLKDRSTDHCES